MHRILFIIAAMMAFVVGQATPGQAQDAGDDCDTLRLSVHGYWSVEKGADAGKGLPLRPLSLVNRSAVTTMPQLAMICRKDHNAGDVILFGDETEYNSPLQPDECRLVALLSVEALRAKTADNFEGERACGTYSIIR